MIFRLLKKLRYYGNKRYCPVCDSHLRCFLPSGLAETPDRRCPICNSVERHRLIMLFLERHTDLFSGIPQKMLHIAPEPELSARFKKHRSLQYISADLNDPKAMLQLDVTDIDFADNTFDVIYCSHVLEHVPNDKQALKEFARVLKSTGWAILQVPIADIDETFEDPSITDPQERQQLFGHWDHVRLYGRDYKNRLEEAGFSVSIISPKDFLTQKEIQQCTLTPSEDIYYCSINDELSQHKAGIAIYEKPACSAAD